MIPHRLTTFGPYHLSVQINRLCRQQSCTCAPHYSSAGNLRTNSQRDGHAESYYLALQMSALSARPVITGRARRNTTNALSIPLQRRGLLVMVSMLDCCGPRSAAVVSLDNTSAPRASNVSKTKTPDLETSDLETATQCDLPGKTALASRLARRRNLTANREQPLSHL